MSGFGKVSFPKPDRKRDLYRAEGFFRAALNFVSSFPPQVVPVGEGREGVLEKIPPRPPFKDPSPYVFNLFEFGSVYLNMIGLFPGEEERFLLALRSVGIICSASDLNLEGTPELVDYFEVFLDERYEPRSKITDSDEGKALCTSFVGNLEFWKSVPGKGVFACLLELYGDVRNASPDNPTFWEFVDEDYWKLSSSLGKRTWGGLLKESAGRVN